jgi:hypothetical protein
MLSIVVLYNLVKSDAKIETDTNLYLCQPDQPFAASPAEINLILIKSLLGSAEKKKERERERNLKNEPEK